MKVSQLTIAFFGSTQEQQQLQKKKMINDYVEEENEAQVKIQGYVNTVQHIVT